MLMMPSWNSTGWWETYNCKFFDSVSTVVPKMIRSSVDNKGKEVITRFTVKDFSNSGTFYTDANGRQQVRRELNKRGDFEYDPEEEPVSSNYYPVTSKIVIKDETKKLEVAVLNDRAQGGTSLKEGTVELMIHRRLLGDDDKGVKEALNEIQYDKGLYVRGQHYLTFGSTESKVANGNIFQTLLPNSILVVL
jgi:lysosomal alpha-mannosidase